MHTSWSPHLAIVGHLLSPLQNVGEELSLVDSYDVTVPGWRAQLGQGRGGYSGQQLAVVSGNICLIIPDILRISNSHLNDFC